MPLLTVTGISKRNGEQTVLSNIAFSQNKHEKIAIAGETGSGKSTLLKIIAGLLQPDDGKVIFDGEFVEGPEHKLIAGHPAIAYLPQDFALQKFLRVDQVLQYASKLSDKKAQEIFRICRIDYLLDRKTDALSGGEKQRIAIARLLISSPKLLLLDEPFSNLDMVHENILKYVIDDVGRKLRITCILVSHDPLDTLSWADTIIVMKAGAIVQHGTPQQVYRYPVNEYVAGLFGKYNVLNTKQCKQFSLNVNGSNHLILRPENFKITSSTLRTRKCKVQSVVFFGSYYEIEVLLGDKNLIIKTDSDKYQVGDTVHVSASIR